ncbi:MAG: bifunctional phosphopantothenoylcysteine decarboxylase/phosphopantothenate--cysteine ligase CoaBC [Chloroflexota bacterium]|nr:MAG: bifunctional phosphopantothenoylcysteine decarboxylase/phosphopantothenate--cysteine ligase CoaBC [Chloroflexota bacterium]
MSDPPPLAGRLVCLGVTGSIAAYKSAELARALIAAGAEVQALMTHSAAAFLRPLTLETLTRRRVMSDPLALLPDQRIGHIVAADTADAIVVAPATARWLAAMAHGLSDDVVTATCLATSAPVVVAPAMDGEMYAHPATQANLARLREFGYRIVEPEEGPLASGAVGLGRLAGLERIVGAVEQAVADRPVRAPDPARRPPIDPTLRPLDLEGRHIVVSAGGTAEPIDPVRYIGNRSSGRMGAAIAEAALARGAQVTIVAGRVEVPLPRDATVIPAETTAAMREAVLAALPQADALIMAAAVADFRPRRVAEGKIGRSAAGLTLELEPTEDILAEAAALAHERLKPRPVIVGFAAETGSLVRAVEKAARKRVDLLVANDVNAAGSGFGTETNQVTLIVPGRAPEPWPLLTKREVADRLLDHVVTLSEGQEQASMSPSARTAAPGQRASRSWRRSRSDQRTDHGAGP